MLFIQSKVNFVFPFSIQKVSGNWRRLFWNGKRRSFLQSIECVRTCSDKHDSNSLRCDIESMHTIQFNLHFYLFKFNSAFRKILNNKWSWPSIADHRMINIQIARIRCRSVVFGVHMHVHDAINYCIYIYHSVL